MSSPAGSPPAPKRNTSTPYATFRRDDSAGAPGVGALGVGDGSVGGQDVAPGSSELTGDAHRQTGPRLRMNVPLEPSELLTLPSEVPTLPPEPQFTPSVAPEALKRPYASLVPQKKEDTPVTSIPAAAPLPNLEAKAPAGPSKAPSSSSKAPSSSSKAPSSSSKAPAHSSRSGARPVCKKHKIVHGKDGRCLLCVKEAETSGGAGWKVFIALGVLSVIVGGVVALLTP